MIRKRKDNQSERKQSGRKQLGVLVDSALWTQMKITALEQSRTAGELLEDAMREYLKKRGSKKSGLA